MQVCFLDAENGVLKSILLGCVLGCLKEIIYVKNLCVFFFLMLYLGIVPLQLEPSIWHLLWGEFIERYCINLIVEAVVPSYKRTDLTGTGFFICLFICFCCCFSGANWLRPLPHIITLPYVDSCLDSTKLSGIMSYLVTNQGTIQPKSGTVLTIFTQIYP